MTLIENDSPKVQYTGPFIKGQLLPLTFPYIATEDVKMIIDDKPAIFNVDYEIITEPNDEHPVAYPNSAYIKSDLPNAKQITLYRVTPLDQQAPFPQQSKFRSERVEQALDKLTMQQQEQEEQLSRCIIAPITLETFNGQLPAPAADQALKWNTDGTELENYDIIGEQEAFETDINTRFEEQSTSINTQFSEFRNEINENLEAVLNAAEKLEELDAAVQNTENAAERANQSALSAQNSAQSAQEAIAIIDTKSSETIEDINDIKTDAITNVELVADMGKQEIQDLVDEMKDNADIIINRVGLNMFDPVVKDHILTYEESKGLALQGTYVYKDAIAGTRFGYPDFYNKCLEEYRDSENQKQWLKSNVTKVGSLVDNEGVVSGFSTANYAKFPNNFQPSSNSWEFVLKIKTGDTIPSPCQIIAFQKGLTNETRYGTRLGINNNHFTISVSYNGTAWDIVGGATTGATGAYTVLANTTYYLKYEYTGSVYKLSYSLDGEIYTQDCYVASTTPMYNANTACLIGLWNNGSFTEPFNGSIDFNESYIDINGSRWWSGVDTAIKNPNGHLFYDISDKDKIDNIFATTGLAWYYGIDEENERIFLPRNVWFEQMSMNDVGKAIEAGLPNITGTIDDVRGSAGGTTSSSGAIYWASSSNSWRNTVAEGNSGGSGISINASRSNPIYGNSNTVQPNAVKKLLYICVGNTVSDTSWVDVVTQVEEGVKDIEKAKDEAVDAMKSVAGGTVPLGFIGSAILGIDETLNLQRYLNGQIILQDQFKGFTKFLKRRIELYPSLACTEDEWQTTVTMSAFSQCGKFVIDDNAGTIRLPKVVNIQGLTDLSKLGEIVEAGLPTHTHTRGTMNITGQVTETLFGSGSVVATGALSAGTVNGICGTGGKATKARSIAFNASKAWTGSTSTGNYSKALATTNTVQQEQIQYPYFIQVATGAETEDNIINEIELNNPFSLLDYKYSEYELNNISWLRSNGQYNSKAVYPAVYDLLLKIYNGTETKAGVSVKLSTETYGDYDFVLNTTDETFRLPKLTKNRVLVASKQSTTNDLTWYNLYSDGWCEQGGSITSGSGWRTISFIKQFKDLPNITTSCSDNGNKDSCATSLSINSITTSNFQCALCWASNSQWGYITATEDRRAFWQASGYVNISNVDSRLYFYVGETVQNANLINAGRIEEVVSQIKADKLDKSAVKAYIVESYVNGTSWYRVYSDGWCEQGGYTKAGTTINLLKPYANTNYSVAIGVCSASNDTQPTEPKIAIKSTTQFKFNQAYNGNTTYNASSYEWRLAGFIA